MLRFPFVSFPEDDKGRSDFPWFHDHGRGGTSSIIELGRINHHLWFYQSQFSKHTKCIDPLIGALSSFYGLLPIIQLWCLEISICVAVIFCKWLFLGNPWKVKSPTTVSHTWFGFQSLNHHQVHGDRGHGYFVPAPESKDLAGRLDCQGLPVTCADPAACQVGEQSNVKFEFFFSWQKLVYHQGTANAITHNSSVDKDSITVVWTPPSAMEGEVVFQVDDSISLLVLVL